MWRQPIPVPHIAPISLQSAGSGLWEKIRGRDWAVGLHRAHAYKTGFVSLLGQWCYLRMGQDLTGAPSTYTRLKDIATGAISSPNPEPALAVAASNSVFDHFMDDDLGKPSSFDALYEFLHNHYFPRLAWTKLTLSPAKCKFFTRSLEVLGMRCEETGIRPSTDKMAMIMQNFKKRVNVPYSQ